MIGYHYCSTGYHPLLMFDGLTSDKDEDNEMRCSLIWEGETQKKLIY